ncbi:MAG: FtsX-like permease family protein, partial [Longimicrobiales bacterium]|nr:FtsX-like permease family protein [Longimicrobiales bacterium]
ATQMEGRWQLIQRFRVAFDRSGNKLLIDRPDLLLVCDGQMLFVRSEQFPGRHLEMDADQPVYAIRTAEETFAQGVAPMRAATLFLSLFAVFALILASVGIYSVVSYSVSDRTKEIGVRVALGADRGRVERLVVAQALVPVAVGAVLGIVASIALGGALERLLFQVGGSDPLTLALVATLLVSVAALASWVPAVRAARLDPVTSLRAE